MKKLNLIQITSCLILISIIIFLDPSKIKDCPKGTQKIGVGKVENEHSILSCQIENHKGEYIFQGPYIEWYPNGNILIKGNYSNNKKDGYWTTRREDGTNAIKVLYLDGKMHGNQMNLKQKTSLGINVLYDSRTPWIWKQSLSQDSGSKRLSKKDYLGGGSRAQGEWSEWYETGEKKITTLFQDNELNGDYIEFYKNGSIKKTGQHLDGYADGIWKEFRLDGTLATRVNFVNNIPTARICFDSEEKVTSCN